MSCNNSAWQERQSSLPALLKELVEPSPTPWLKLAAT
jgi:hypothetical protein